MGDTSGETMLREGYGFDWWPGNFKVRIRVNGPRCGLDFPLYRLNVQTDFLCDVDTTASSFEKNISDFNRKALTFAASTHPAALARALLQYGTSAELELDPSSARIWLASTAYVRQENK